MAPKKKEIQDYEADLELIRSIQNGDGHAFARLFHAYYSDLCKFAMQYTGAPDVAEDLIQEVQEASSLHKTYSFYNLLSGFPSVYVCYE